MLSFCDMTILALFLWGSSHVELYYKVDERKDKYEVRMPFGNHRIYL